MKKILLLTIVLLVAITSQSQNVDKPKMDKDLKVASNVLATILSQNGGNRFIWHGNENIKTRYVPDYGVIFTLSDFSGPFTISSSFNYGQNVRGFPSSSGTRTIINNNSTNSYNKAKTLIKEDKSIKGEAIILEKVPDHEVAIVRDRSENNTVDRKTKKEQMEEMKNSFIEFLSDYGSVIRQLSGDHKIMLKTSTRQRNWGLAYYGLDQKEPEEDINVSVEVKKSDLDEYTKGSIYRAELVERMNILEKTSSSVKEPAVEIFSAAIQRLYEIDLSDTYYMNARPWYERTEGYGINFHLKYYSSENNNGFFSVPTKRKSELDQEERDKLVNDMYPDFLAGFKENILDYGHLLRNLKEEEVVTFEIDLTECKDCEMPREIEVSVKKLVLSQYRDGAISLDQALNSINVNVVR